jgi:hypothetical protein
MPDGAPLWVLTTCATPPTAAYRRLSRPNGNFSNKWRRPRASPGCVAGLLRRLRHSTRLLPPNRIAVPVRPHRGHPDDFMLDFAFRDCHPADDTRLARALPRQGLPIDREQVAAYKASTDVLTEICPHTEPFAGQSEGRKSVHAGGYDDKIDSAMLDWRQIVGPIHTHQSASRRCKRSFWPRATTALDARAARSPAAGRRVPPPPRAAGRPS